MRLLEGDALVQLDHVEPKSVQAIVLDPPYNIGKDTWDTIDNYVEWFTSVCLKLQEKLKDNGSFLFFHNDMEQIAELMVSLKARTRFRFRQMIVWNKRFEGSSKKGYLDGYIVKEGNHNWNKMAEYILFFTFDNHHKLREARDERKVKQTTISSEILSKTGGMTGWYSNLETGKNYPTEETIVPITKHLGLTLDDIVPKFRNQKTHHSVWNYDMAPRLKIHLTPKPVPLLETILRHVTDEGDTVLDCFAGSGSLGLACKNLRRDCILIEKEPTYCAWIRQTVLQESA